MGLPDGGHLVLSIKRDNRMTPEFYADLEEAAGRALDVGKRSDVYMGMAAQPMLPKGRGTTETAIAIPALWLDLDFEKGFRDVAGVRRFLAALPLQPSLLVCSGGGVHAYWQFKEWLEVDQADNVAAALELGWWHYCREVARLEMKAELDAIGDLARVMRIPGTWNFKRETALEVFELDAAGTPLNASEFEPWRSEARQRSIASAVATFDFSLREDAQPPFEKWHVAATNQPEIERTFNHTIKMPVDGSLSGYDLGIATRLDQLGWTAQEIVDTLITHRRKWSSEITDINTAKDPLHLRDRGYFERVLRKARASNNSARVSQEAIRLAEEVTDELDIRSGLSPDAAVRVKWFHAVSEMVSVEVVDIWAVDSIEGHWNVRIRAAGEMRDVRAGSPSKLLEWGWWVNLVMSSQSSVENLPAKPPQAFRGLMVRAGMMLRVVGRGQGTTMKDSFLDYLVEVAESAPPFEEAAVLERQSFRKMDGGPLGINSWGRPEDCLFVRPDAMHFDVKSGRCPPIPNLRAALVEIGFVSRVVAVHSDDGNGTSRNYYCFPLSKLMSSRVEEIAAESEDGLSGLEGSVQ